MLTREGCALEGTLYVFSFVLSVLMCELLSLLMLLLLLLLLLLMESKYATGS
jgi:hypothetical protein